MADVMIGIDPHKGSHTAVAIGAAEEPLGEVRVDACPSQAEQLWAWAAGWPERAWAVEDAAGLGNPLAQQLFAAGERVLDVPPKLAARGRLLQAGDTNKNDPLRSLKRRISDAVYAALAADARQAAAACSEGPGGQPGNRSESRAAGSHPERRLFGQATPGPATTIRLGTAGPAPIQPNGGLRRAGHSPAASKKSQATS